MIHCSAETTSGLPRKARHRFWLVAIQLWALLAAMPLQAEQRHARVSPELEIELIDPRRDARGNPAVDVRVDEFGNQQIDIAPSLIVHRYYYTGDRSFRGPDMPGGPSIVVTRDPRSGQQIYLPVQMLPGSPIVHYQAHSIEYDFGDHTVIISFPHNGDPIVSYRNGRPWKERLGKTLGVHHVASGWKKATSAFSTVHEKSKLMAQATHNMAHDMARPLTLPAQNLARLIPGAAAVSDPQLAARVTEQTAVREREADLRAAERQAVVEEVDIPTRP